MEEMSPNDWRDYLLGRQLFVDVAHSLNSPDGSSSPRLHPLLRLSLFFTPLLFNHMLIFRISINNSFFHLLILLFYTNFQSLVVGFFLFFFCVRFFFFFFFLKGISIPGDGTLRHLVSFLIPIPELLGHWNFNATPPPCLLIKRTTAFI